MKTASHDSVLRRPLNLRRPRRSLSLLVQRQTRAHQVLHPRHDRRSTPPRTHRQPPLELSPSTIAVRVARRLESERSRHELLHRLKGDRRLSFRPTELFGPDADDRQRQFGHREGVSLEERGRGQEDV